MVPDDVEVLRDREVRIVASRIREAGLFLAVFEQQDQLAENP